MRARSWWSRPVGREAAASSSRSITEALISAGSTRSTTGAVTTDIATGGAGAAEAAERETQWFDEKLTFVDNPATMPGNEYARIACLVWPTSAVGLLHHEIKAPCSMCQCQQKREEGLTADGAERIDLAQPAFEAGGCEARVSPQPTGRSRVAKGMLTMFVSVYGNRCVGSLAGLGGTGPPVERINPTKRIRELLHSLLGPFRGVG